MGFQGGGEMSSDGARSEDAGVREVLERWARATREGAQDSILDDHEPDVVIYDVLEPLLYRGAEAYRRSWDAWQPETVGAATFEFEELEVTEGAGLAFAHGVIRCGGTTPGGHTFRDRVRATFCLRRRGGRWWVAHQHISLPRR